MIKKIIVCDKCGDELDVDDSEFDHPEVTIHYAGWSINKDNPFEHYCSLCNPVDQRDEQ